jgi:hypothetical protein
MKSCFEGEEIWTRIDGRGEMKKREEKDIGRRRKSWLGTTPTHHI